MNVQYNESLIENYGELMTIRLKTEMLGDSLGEMFDMTLDQLITADLSIILEDSAFLTCKSVDEIERYMVVVRETCRELIEAAKGLDSNSAAETLLN